MGVIDLLITAWGNLTRRKLRTVLTTFAVVIGAATVALMVSLGAGVQQYLNEEANSFISPNTIFVSKEREEDFKAMDFQFDFGSTPQEVKEKEEAKKRVEPFTKEQLGVLRGIPHVLAVYPMVGVEAESIKSSRHAEEAYQIDLQPYYPGERLDYVAVGGFTGEYEEIILAQQYLEIFGWRAEEAIGQKVIITLKRAAGQTQGVDDEAVEKKEFSARVVGVTRRTMRGTLGLVPYPYVIEMMQWQQRDRSIGTRENFTTGRLTIDDPAHVDAVARAAQGMGLLTRLPSEMLDELNRTFLMIEAVLSVFGLIALSVASLGIINTLIMATYERTREIGVLKAVGASKRVVRQLFTLEAALIGMIGGIGGVGLAWSIGQLINPIARANMGKGVPTFNLSAFPLWLVLGVIGFSTGVGAVAGLYPADRAAELDPIAALRYE